MLEALEEQRLMESPLLPRGTERTEMLLTLRRSRVMASRRRVRRKVCRLPREVVEEGEG